MDLIAAGLEAHVVDRPGGIFVRRGEQMSDEDRVLLQTVARVVLADDARHAGRADRPPRPRRRRRCRCSTPTPRAGAEPPPSPADAATRDLAFFNGLGGFTPDGREYVIIARPRRTRRRRPGSTCIANPHFGTVVSESGSAYTWARTRTSSGSRRGTTIRSATPSGEAFYLRDEETGHFWSPTPLPARGSDAVRRSATASATASSSTPRTASSRELCGLRRDRRAGQVRACCKMRNASGRPRRLSVTGYCEWVLGDTARPSRACTSSPRSIPAAARSSRATPTAPSSPTASRSSTCSETHAHASPATAPSSSAATARSAQPGGHAPRAALGPRRRGPRSVRRDAGAARRSRTAQEREIVFTLGVGPRRRARRGTLVQRFRGAGAARTRARGRLALLEPHARRGPRRNARPARQRPGQRLAAVPDARLPHVGAQRLLPVRRRVRLPRPAAGRDGAGPRRARDCCASSSCVRGAPVPRRRRAALVASARRARRAHALLRRLPLAAARDLPLRRDAPATPACSTRRVPFLEGRAVNAGRGGATTTCRSARTKSATLYEHCVRAIEHGLRFGAHGLPLMGCGDWNDGMNLRRRSTARARASGSAFFLYDVLDAVRRARARGAATTAFARALRRARRAGCAATSRSTAGTASGTAAPTSTTARRSARPTNAECQIDSIAQSWSVLSGAGEPRARARRRWTRVDDAPGAPRRAADPAARSAVRQVAARTRATSKATCPACARTAASTRTPRSGP